MIRFFFGRGAALSLLFCLFLSACSDGGDSRSVAVVESDPVVEEPEVDPNLIEVEAGENFETRLKEALINAEPGHIIVLPEGEFDLGSSLSLDVDNVTVRGQGSDSTVLNFSSQQSGGESFLVTSNNAVLEYFAVVDTPSDGVKFKFSNGATMRGLRVEWTCGACSENGGYGLYPVQTQNVLIEDCEVVGGSDSGIYVGQSNNVIVRRNYVSLNVAGIEIENSTNSDVFENTAVDNTGGILVFDLPNLSQEGAITRVFNNDILHNNTANFAPGSGVLTAVPAGTGILAMAFDDVEIFNNRIEDNGSLAIAVVSYDISGFTTDDPNYDPYPRAVFIHDNSYSNNGSDPDGIAAALAGEFDPLGGIPDIVYDGIAEIGGAYEDADRICVDEDDSVTRGRVFGAQGGAEVDPAFFDCAHASLPEVVLDTPAEIEDGEVPLTDEEIAEICAVDTGVAVNFDAVEVSCPTLSGYNLFSDSQEPRSGANGGVHYELTTPLFTDYASKYRFIFVPEGKAGAYNSREAFEFPVGTIISKTFTMPRDFLNPGAGEDIIETRLLIHRADGWTALPYIWREDGSGANLAVAGGTRQLSWIHSDGSSRSTLYDIPDTNACKTCHGLAEESEEVDKNSELVIIGPKARFLNRDNSYAGQQKNQLAHMSESGILAGLPADLAAIDTAPDWEDTAVDLESRAKAYIDINCAHCHRPAGFASNSALFLEYWRAVDLGYGICKSPIAAGKGSGGLDYSIVPGDADASITIYRMDSNESEVRMPEIGRTLIHDEGVALIREWINSMSGGCD